MVNRINIRLKEKMVNLVAVYSVIVFISIGCVHSSVIRLDGEKAQSLYDSNDEVFVLTNENFYQSVFDQPYASNVEFYNSFCGFCRNFAPIYKAFAQDVLNWRDIVRISAIDCADDANNDICRDMEIMRYPTLRYFPPNYTNETTHLGIEVQHDPRTVGEPHLIELLTNSSTTSRSWPNLQPIEMMSADGLFASLPSHIQYIFIVYDPKNGTETQKVALDLRSINEVQIRRVNSNTVATKLGLDNQSAVYVGIKSAETIEMVKQLEELNRTTLRSTIEHYLKSKGVQINLDKSISGSTSSNIPLNELSGADVAIIDHVKAHPQSVFQSDLESAIRFSIFHELVKYNSMNDEQIAALKGFLSVLHKYSPLGDNGERFLAELNSFVNNEPVSSGKALSDKVKELEQKYHPVFSSSRWIGCKPSVAGHRGYSCGLWQLFHYLSVQATNSDKTHDPLEVLHAIHGFVKHYFGCTHCSQHFQEMAERNGIWGVTTKDEAVIWLWTAHNEVNNRLAGDNTEDPAFPKIQYPSRNACPQCYQQVIPVQGATPAGNSTPHWDSGEILYYLRRVYSLFNLSRYGVDDESILPEMLTSAYSSKLKTSTSTGFAGAISEMDVRMGILLYVFCMLIIVVAVKLFLHRGYRKKIYTHDFLGKI